jgi:hypothetical protein
VNDGMAAIEANVRLAVEQFGPLTDFDFGLDRRSVEWVDGFLERQRARPGFDPDRAPRLAAVIGSFLGACLVANTDGAWRWSDERGQWCVRFAPGAEAYPFAKVEKQLRNGRDEGDSVVSFYDFAVDHVATGRLGRTGQS